MRIWHLIDSFSFLFFCCSFLLNDFDVFGGEERIRYYIMCLVETVALYVVLVWDLIDWLKILDQAPK